MGTLTAEKVARLRKKIMRPWYYHDRRKKMHQHLEYWREFRYIDCVSMDGDDEQIEANKAKFKREFPIALRKYNYYVKKEKEHESN